VGLHKIEIDYTAALITLPFHHRDPFDRLLMAQSLVEKVVLATNTAVCVPDIWNSCLKHNRVTWLYLA
jgi:PIN domain nuclease of toxin-antitoxin system